MKGDAFMKTVAALISLLAALVLVGCSPGQSGGGRGSGFRVSGYAAPLSDREFNDLTAEQQYQVISKLTATVFKGMYRWMSSSKCRRDWQIRNSR